MTASQILLRIEKLQATQQYADEIESVRLTKLIERLLKLLGTVNE